MKLSETELKLLKDSNVDEFLINWGRNNYRCFPWRYTFDPYRVAISELLLRRTRASQVIDSYIRITQRCDSMCSLASVGHNFIEDMVSHLGIKRRSALIAGAAEYICKNYNNKIPADSNLLRKIPGFGDYTISAVRVFGFGLNDALIDANTVRIFSRILGIEICESLRKAHVLNPVYEMALGSSDPVKFGYAILDLGAIVCKPAPECQVCPLNDMCSYSIHSKDKS